MSQTVIEPEVDGTPGVEDAELPPEEVILRAETGEAAGPAGPEEMARIAAVEERLERTTIRRDAWTLSIFVFSAIALLAAVFGIGLGWRAVDESKRNNAASGPAPAAEAPAPATASATLSDFAISPAELRVAEGGTLKATNVGAVPHNLVVKGKGLTTRMIESGGKDEITLTGLPPGTYTVICDVPGHEAAGGSQSLDLQPSQGGFVEFTLTDPGQYPMVTHKFSNVGKGALGLFDTGSAPGTMGH